MGLRANPKKLNSEALWDYALKVLGQRAHSANELRVKLLRRAETIEAVTGTLTKLREYGYTDDKKFSEAFASSRLANLGIGGFRVLRELKSKRVAGGVASRAVEKIYAGTNEEQLIEAFLARKYRNRNLREFLQEEKNLASVYRRLRTAGFTSSGTMTILKRYAKAVDDWNEPEEEEEEPRRSGESE
jgi:regulatory protein